MPAEGSSPAPGADELRAALRRDGAVVVRRLLDETWCARLGEAIERCRLRPSVHYGVLSTPGAPLVDSDLFRWSDDPAIGELTHDSPLTAVAARLIGSDDVVLVEDQWFASAPGATTSSPWHQDQPYYKLDRPFVTIWITLDAVGPGSSLRVVEGSHDTGTLYAPVEFSAGAPTIGAATATMEPVPDVEADLSSRVRSWDLRPGDAVALDSRTLHATGDRAVDHAFRRVSTRWADPATRYVERGAHVATFWQLLPHGLTDGDLLACPTFPLVRTRSFAR